MTESIYSHSAAQLIGSITVPDLIDWCSVVDLVASREMTEVSVSKVNSADLPVFERRFFLMY